MAGRLRSVHRESIQCWPRSGLHSQPGVASPQEVLPDGVPHAPGAPRDCLRRILSLVGSAAPPGRMFLSSLPIRWARSASPRFPPAIVRCASGAGIIVPLGLTIFPLCPSGGRARLRLAAHRLLSDAPPAQGILVPLVSRPPAQGIIVPLGLTITRASGAGIIVQVGSHDLLSVIT